MHNIGAYFNAEGNIFEFCTIFITLLTDPAQFSSPYEYEKRPKDGLNNAFQAEVAARDFSNTEISRSGP